jgi:FixJ family two-component response regulator
VAEIETFIAVVDDDEEIGVALVEFLLAAGLSARAFRSAEEFLASSEVTRTACLITDIMMPGKSGLELIRQLAEAGHKIPSIVITGHPSEPVNAAVSHVLANAFLLKPVDMKELLRIIKVALEAES